MKIVKGKTKIGIIGLGYIGLPLSIEFQKHFKVVGYDLNKDRIRDLKKNLDFTKEVTKKNLKFANNIEFSNSERSLKDCNIFIICVPTPINKKNQPDLSNLKKACITVSKNLKKNDTVIFESTVYPGVTDDFCTPIIEKLSKLKFNVDFFTGYSPERVNPGDKIHTIANTIKITSGSSKKIASYIDDLYRLIVKNGTYKVSSIKTAEAAKIIENTQRDLNIALVNELSMIFNLMDLNTTEVINAASTKWNFMPFQPGLVGGHCIGVDPYYLTYEALNLGITPKVILSGRKTNDGMAKYVFNRMHSAIPKKKGKNDILIMGMTFKENCPDIRNSKVIDIYKKFNKFQYNIDVYDPHLLNLKIGKTNINLIRKIPKKKYDGILIAVAHKEFIRFGIKNLLKISKKNTVIFDLKNIYKSKITMKL